MSPIPARTALCKVLLWTSLLVLVTVSACNPAASPPTVATPAALPPPSLVISTAVPPENVAPTSTPQPTTPAASPTPTPSVAEEHFSSARYEIQVQFDYWAHHLDVSQVIRYRNPLSEPLQELVLVAEPNRWKNAFTLKKLSLESGADLQGYRLQGGILTVPLPQPLEPGVEISLTAGYEIDLPRIPPPEQAERPDPFGYTDSQVNLVDWYLFLPPYQPGEGWLVHAGYYFGEHLSYDLADYQVDIELVGSGTEPILAASAPADRQGKHFNYELINARSFALSASPYYKVFTQEVDGVTVFSYAFPIHPNAGEGVLKDASAALALYSQLFGPYPHATMSVVEADFFNGMEYDGLFFLSRGFYNLYDGTPKGYLTIIAVHEIAHQWWYGYVGNDQALEPWLDEALCTYSELLFYEHTYPELVKWWWDYRIDFYHPAGKIDLPIHAYPHYNAYRDAVYLRGAQFLQSIRSEMGDEAFFAFLKGYLSKYRFQTASSQDFFTTLAEYSQADLQSIFDDYLTR